MTTRGRLWRVVAGAIALGAAFWMAVIIGSATVRSWPDAVKLIWLLGMVALLVAGVGFLGQVGRSLLGEKDIHWFPSRAATRGPTGLLRVVGTGTLVLGVVALIGLWQPDVAPRVALAGIGVFTLSLLTARSRGLWDHPDVVFWREILGDRVVWGVAVAIACAFIVMAVVVK